MIIVRLLGGLGNQMFQYSLGRHLALRFNTELKLDITTLQDRKPRKDFTFRNYELGAFHIQGQIATKKEIASFIPIDAYFGNVIATLKKKAGLIKIISESERGFEPSILNTGANSYLLGYWQTEKYFSDIKNLILKDFILRPNIIEEIERSNSLKQLIQMITRTNSVSVHIRRGDYANNPTNAQHYALCPPDYYMKAIHLINSTVENLNVFFFSDEPEWIHSNLKITNTNKIIEGNLSYVDLYLMSLCKHNIIANSTFSWWGAWLNNKPNKIVIAPKQWYNDSKSQNPDLIPEKWIKL